MRDPLSKSQCELDATLSPTLCDNFLRSVSSYSDLILFVQITNLGQGF